jgi:ferredoxin
MRIKADAGKCQGYGNCVDLAPDHFDLDDDGIVVVLRGPLDEPERKTVGDAVRSCPVQALWLSDDDA